MMSNRVLWYGLVVGAALLEVGPARAQTILRTPSYNYNNFSSPFYQRPYGLSSTPFRPNLPGSYPFNQGPYTYPHLYQYSASQNPLQSNYTGRAPVPLNGYYPSNQGYFPGYGPAPMVIGAPSKLDQGSGSLPTGTLSVDLPPAPVLTSSGNLETTLRARIIVDLPTADALVWFDDTAMKQTGPQRLFVTPRLDATTDYRFQVRARWTEDGETHEQTQSVDLRAGVERRLRFPAGK